MTVTNPSPSVLPDLLRYEPETGKLYWLTRPERLFPNLQAHRAWNTKYAGDEAFKAGLNGYKTGTIFGWKTYAHRVIWALSYGAWPILKIDHINGDRSDNRLSNLRLATDLENAHNSAKHLTNASGYKGVSAKRGKWTARIRSDGKIFRLGVFDTPELAHEAYCKAAMKHHGEFARIP